MKTCSKCLTAKPVSDFSPASGGKYLRPECRECARKLSAERKALRKQYGLPPADYVCPICLRSADTVKNEGGSAGSWVVDHSHNTGEFRGWLCHKCNRAIGNFEDGLDRLARAIDYLTYGIEK